MKKLLLILILLVPFTASAQLTTNQGGTGLKNISEGSIPFGSIFNLRMATSSAFQFNNAGSRLTVTNASTTALSISANTYHPSGIWNSDGFVGIGTTTPSNWLHVQGGTIMESFLAGNSILLALNHRQTNDVMLEITNNASSWYLGNTTAGNFGLRANSTGIGTPDFTVTTAGRVGIATSTPGTRLSIGNTGANTINISETATSTFGSGLNIRTGCFAVNGTCLSAGGGSGTPGGSQGQVQYNNSSTFAGASNLFIDASGRVGVATTTTLTANLTVYGPRAYSNIQAFTGNLDISAATTTYDTVVRTASTSPQTVTLPLCTTSTRGLQYTVYDEMGDATFFPITVSAKGGNTLMGTTSEFMTENYASATFMCSATTGKWFISSTNNRI